MCRYSFAIKIHYKNGIQFNENCVSEQVKNNKMIFLIWVLITLNNYYSSYAATNQVIENVYIDTLIQRYLSEEKDLWEYIYSNSGDRRDRNVNNILNQIRIKHDDIFQDRYLEYVMSVAYMSKFIKYVDFYNVQNIAEGYQHYILSESQRETYMTLDMTFSVYNNSQRDLFEAIYNVS